jgi:hypothetical protein
MRAIKTGDQSNQLKKAISRVNLEPHPGSQSRMSPSLNGFDVGKKGCVL